MNVEYKLRKEYNPSNFLGYSQEGLLNLVSGYIEDKLEENGLEDEVHNIRLMVGGSRIYGKHKPNSDVDIIMEYEGTAREDTLTNILDEEHLWLNDDVKVDIIPIRVDKSGTLEEWLEREREYYHKKDPIIEGYHVPDFPLRETIQSYEYVSMTPEKSGEAWREEYEEYIQKIIREGKKAGLSHEEIQKLLDMFTSKYLRYIHELNSKRSRLASPHVVGFSKFPASTMQKRAESYHKTEEEYLNFIDTFFKKTLPKYVHHKEVEEAGGEIAYLEKQLEEYKDMLRRMKEINKVVRNPRLSEEEKIKKIREIGFVKYGLITAPSDLLKPDELGRVGYKSYDLTSIRNKIKRLEQRIAELEKKEEKKGEVEVSADYPEYGFKIVKDYGKDRVMIYFENIPPADLRNELKKHGFRYSPRWKAWVRKLTSNAVYDARNILFGYYNIHRPASEKMEESRNEFLRARKHGYQGVIRMTTKEKELAEDLGKAIYIYQTTHNPNILISVLKRYKNLFEEGFVDRVISMLGKKPEERYEEGKYYEGKGYYWRGKFIKSNEEPEAYELGYYHGKQIAKKLTVEELKRFVKKRPANKYEEGKIDAFKDELMKRTEGEEINRCEKNGGIWIEEYQECALYNSRYAVYIGEKTGNYYDERGNQLSEEEIQKILVCNIPEKIYEFSRVFILDDSLIINMWDEACKESIKQGGDPDTILTRVERIYYEKFSKMVFNRVVAILPKVVDSTYDIYREILTFPVEYRDDFKNVFAHMIREAINRNEVPYDAVSMRIIVKEFKELIKSEYAKDIKIVELTPKEIILQIPDIGEAVIDTIHGANEITNKIITVKRPDIDIVIPDIILIAYREQRDLGRMVVEKDHIRVIDNGSVFYMEVITENNVPVPIRVSFNYTDLKKIGYKIGDEIHLRGEGGDYYLLNTRTGKKIGVTIVEQGVRRIPQEDILKGKIVMIPIGEDFKHFDKVKYLEERIHFVKEGDIVYFYGTFGSIVFEGKINTFKDITGDAEIRATYDSDHLIPIYHLSKYVDLYMYIQEDMPLVVVDSADYEMKSGKPVPRGESIRIYLAPIIGGD